jgi:heterodisulfide reductase subunit C
MAPLSWHSVDLTLDECIKCNICTSHCPVSAVTDLSPAPNTLVLRRSAFVKTVSRTRQIIR